MDAIHPCVLSLDGNCVLGFHSFCISEPLKKSSSEDCHYDMGGGIEFTTFRDAAKFVLKRDFPEFDFFNGQQARVLFVPPIRLPNRPDLPPTVAIEQQGVLPHLVDREKGHEYEAELFDLLEDFFRQPKEGKRNITVVHGWNKKWFRTLEDDHTTANKQQRNDELGDEYDFLIIDGEHKQIVMIEAKRSLDLDESGKLNYKGIKGLKQLKEQLNYLISNHGHVVTPEWRVAVVMAVQEVKIQNFQDAICKRCQKFLLTQSQSLAKLWGNLKQGRVSRKKKSKKKPKSKTITDATWNVNSPYGDLVGRFVAMTKATGQHFAKTLLSCRQEIKANLTGNLKPLSACEQSLASVKRSGDMNMEKKRDNIGTAKTVIFWNNLQHTLFSLDPKQLIIKGGCGSGKSVILKYKAQQLALAKRNVCFVIQKNWAAKGLPSIYTVLTQIQFRNNRYIKVEQILNQGWQLSDLPSKYPNHDLLIDEYKPEMTEGHFLNKLLQDVDEKKYLWLALEPTSKDHSNGHIYLEELRHNLRNSSPVAYLANDLTNQTQLKGIPQVKPLLSGQMHHDNHHLQPHIFLVDYHEDEKFPVAVQLAISLMGNDAILCIDTEGYSECISEVAFSQQAKEQGWVWYSRFNTFQDEETQVKKLEEFFLRSENDLKHPKVLFTEYENVPSVEGRNVIVMASSYGQKTSMCLYRAIVQLTFVLVVHSECCHKDTMRTLARHQERFPQKFTNLTKKSIEDWVQDNLII